METLSLEILFHCALFHASIVIVLFKFFYSTKMVKSNLRNFGVSDVYFDRGRIVAAGVDSSSRVCSVGAGVGVAFG